MSLVTAVLCLYRGDVGEGLAYGDYRDVKKTCFFGSCFFAVLKQFLVFSFVFFL